MGYVVSCATHALSFPGLVLKHTMVEIVTELKVFLETNVSFESHRRKITTSAFRKLRMMRKTLWVFVDFGLVSRWLRVPYFQWNLVMTYWCANWITDVMPLIRACIIQLKIVLVMHRKLLCLRHMHQCGSPCRLF